MEESDPESVKARRLAKTYELGPTETRQKIETETLTGLLKREVFEKHMSDLIERFRRGRHGDALKRVSFLIIDVDHFKSVNDTHGHPEGDRVLRLVADILKTHIRKTDFATRWGGEEFAIGFEDADGKAFAKAEKIRKDIESSIVMPDGRRVTVSIGIAETTGIRDIKRLYKRADEALYEAKEAGRNRVVVAGFSRDNQDNEESRIAT